MNAHARITSTTFNCHGVFFEVATVTAYVNDENDQRHDLCSATICRSISESLFPLNEDESCTFSVHDFVCEGYQLRRLSENKKGISHMAEHRQYFNEFFTSVKKKGHKQSDINRGAKPHIILRFKSEFGDYCIEKSETFTLTKEHDFNCLQHLLYFKFGHLKQPQINKAFAYELSAMCGESKIGYFRTFLPANNIATPNYANWNVYG